MFLEVSLKKKINFNGDFHDISTYNMVISQNNLIDSSNEHSFGHSLRSSQRYPTTVRSVSVLGLPGVRKISRRKDAKNKDPAITSLASPLVSVKKALT